MMAKDASSVRTMLLSANQGRGSGRRLKKANPTTERLVQPKRLRDEDLPQMSADRLELQNGATPSQCLGCL